MNVVVDIQLVVLAKSHTHVRVVSHGFAVYAKKRFGIPILIMSDHSPGSPASPDSGRRGGFAKCRHFSPRTVDFRRRLRCC